jgi:hypothetical protein
LLDRRQALAVVEREAQVGEYVQSPPIGEGAAVEFADELAARSHAATFDRPVLQINEVRANGRLEGLPRCLR